MKDDFIENEEQFYLEMQWRQCYWDGHRDAYALTADSTEGPVGIVVCRFCGDEMPLPTTWVLMAKGWWDADGSL